MSTNPIQTPHGWSKDALLTKAQRYVEEMLSHTHDDWRFAFWSALVLELLIRAALAHISPVLLADPKDWNNLYHALGFQPNSNRFTPISIGTTTLLKRLKEIIPDFTNELMNFGVFHIGQRNEELHSGNTPFDSISNPDWLPKYYQTCKILLISMEEDLKMLLGEEQAQAAERIITAAEDKSAQSINRTIQTHKENWEKNSPEEKKNLSDQAKNWATRHNGHRVKCPSCQSDAIITGEAIDAPLKDIKDDLITETQVYLPSRFECVACQLKISGLSYLTSCGLGRTYKAKFTYEPAEYYHINDEYADYEPDFNDP